jgi:acylphosphatase
MLIKVNGNGSIELIETKKIGISDNQNPMSDANFNNLLKSVKNQRSTNGRRSLIDNAFNNTNNYFTTYQVVQLLQLLNSENFRLQLAKLSYRTITDRSNFNQVYDLLNSQASEDELEAYVNNYNEDSDPTVAMSDASFNSLYKTIQQQWPVSTQMNALTNAFNATNNYFTTYQARQLIQLVNAENNRLQLAKLSYRTITDRSNFNQVYDLLNSQASRDELRAYVNNYSDGNPNVAMSDVNFSSLYHTIQQQWPVNTQMNSLTNAFSSNNNYFTTYQARQLIQIVNAENSRLQLAKLSYRTITDPGNFSQVYDLLNSQASKDELRAYVNNYTGSNINAAMPDANFTAFYQTLERQYLPGEQMISLTNAFNNSSYYFTTAQVKQLIPLVSNESNRLRLAKLSYRTITDRNNFNQLYDLLNSQASRDELDAYVKAYKE